jgi:hypothetical protein
VISTNSTADSSRVRKIYGIAGALITLAFPYLVMLVDHGHLEAEQSFCPFKMLTGFPCPGCGITKSMVCLYGGDIQMSLHHHLFGPFAVLFCAALILVLTAELITKKEFFRKVFYSRKLGYALGAALIMYHFTRLVVFVSSQNLDGILRESVWR